jgi:hypothetical protein
MSDPQPQPYFPSDEFHKSVQRAYLEALDFFNSKGHRPSAEIVGAYLQSYYAAISASKMHELHAMLQNGALHITHKERQW